MLSLSRRALLPGTLLVTTLLLPLPIDAAESSNVIDLFDGKTLNGWHQLGGKAKYSVADGCIVGTSVKGEPNSFLCTEKRYQDFILELEYRVDPKLNSGVQIRSNSKGRGLVVGYQVEIDPSRRAYSAGIYDENRRGWLDDHSDNEPARRAFKQNDWNHYRIVARGDSLKTWINGVPAADLVDSMTLEGFIGLQVHGTGSETPLEIRWRNIRLQDLGGHEWQPLFDGETLDGWEALPGGEWKVRDGAILGTSPATEKRHGLLLSKERFRDFTVRLEFRVRKGNSGFYFRADRVDSAVSVHGFQAEVDEGEATGGLYETGGRAWVARPDSKKLERWYRKGGWNELTVSAHGRRITVHLNGRKTAELLDDPGRREGHLALQLHGSQEMHVEYRNIARLVPASKQPHPLDIIDRCHERRPNGAIALLDESGDLSHWRGNGDIRWTFADGALRIAPGTGSIETRKTFRDFFLHVEFNIAAAEGQPQVNNGNSGVYLQRRYELQLLDSFGRELTPSDCGSLYRLKVPDVNASKPQGDWQSYDILFRAARWDDAGNKIENTRITALHNGEIIHCDVSVPRKTGAGRPEGPEAGPILLQDHGNPVSFRNVWIAPLDLSEL